jgi:hypothetical protein
MKLKICHIRGDKNYWDPPTRDVRPNKPGTTYGNPAIIHMWGELHNFNYLTYRKKIRDVVKNSIIDSKEYDVICDNDEEFKKIITNLKDTDEIIYHSQDDDDIYVSGCLKAETPDGIYNTPYTKFEEASVYPILQRSNFKKTSITAKMLYTLKNPKHGSCNLIMKGAYYHYKELLNDIARRSFNTRSRLMTFIHKTNHGLNIFEHPTVINVEIKTIWSLTKLKKISGHLKVLHGIDKDAFNESMKGIFMNDYYMFKNIDIIDIPRWAEMVEVYEEFKNTIL